LRKIYYILFLSLLCRGLSSAQILVSPLLSDPIRQTYQTGSDIGNYRIAAGTALSPVSVKDTLKLPFFDDFTSITSPIDSFHNKKTEVVTMTTYGLHGLYNGDEITIFDVKTSKSFPQPSINTTHYAKRIDPFTVELYSDQGLTVPVLGTDSLIPAVNIGTWTRSDYKWNQHPDTLKWMNAGGVYINDRYGIDPPSYNVATFDGLDANGKGYSTGNIYSTGLGDALTSLPINLSAYTPVDSLILSFYWQGAGIGERPDATDSLHLQFKDKNGIWRTVWSMKGDSTAFRQVSLTVKDQLYFYNGFQFSFHSFGKISGSYDVWNLDYIVLDTNRTITNPFHPDVAISKIPVSILKKYTAIPYKDFFSAGPDALIEPTQYFTLRNLTSTRGKYGPFPTDRGGISDAFSNVYFEPIKVPPADFKGPDTLLSFTIQPNLITNQNPAIKLKYSINGSSLEDAQIDGIQYHCNDSASYYNMLDNYYAYDDSSAEWGVGLTGAGEFAVKYELAKPAMRDTLIGVDIYFPQIQTNQTGQPFVLTIWENLEPEIILKKQSIALGYKNLNEFKRYMLDEIIVVEDSFFVGYIQSSNYFIQMGFDKNTDSHENVFMNLSGSWQQFTESGSIMIRPVFGSTVSLTTGINNAYVTVLDCEVFPNPGSGIFHISGDVNKVILTDLSGRAILEKNFSDNDLRQFDASSVPEGLYLLRISNEESSGVKKIVISR
jgi:hypothetical protein